MRIKGLGLRVWGDYQKRTRTLCLGSGISGCIVWLFFFPVFRGCRVFEVCGGLRTRVGTSSTVML